MKSHRESSDRQGSLIALDAIFMRCSIRAYLPGTLAEETVRSLLDAVGLTKSKEAGENRGLSPAAA